jgi:hypothetical protein
MNNLWKRHKIIISGIASSIIFLTLFLLLQYYIPSLMWLGTQWLVVAGVPVLIALFIGGYIKSFKGFGIELEAKLKSTIAYMPLETSGFKNNE